MTTLWTCRSLFSTAGMDRQEWLHKTWLNSASSASNNTFLRGTKRRQRKWKLETDNSALASLSLNNTNPGGLWLNAVDCRAKFCILSGPILLQGSVLVTLVEVTLSGSLAVSCGGADHFEHLNALAFLTIQRREEMGGEKIKDQKIMSLTNTHCFSLELETVGRCTGDASGVRCLAPRGWA